MFCDDRVRDALTDVVRKQLFAQSAFLHDATRNCCRYGRSRAASSQRRGPLCKHFSVSPMRALHWRNDTLIGTATTRQRPSHLASRRVSLVASSLCAHRGGWPLTFAKQDRSCPASKSWGGNSSDRAVCIAASRILRLVSTKRFYFCELCGEEWKPVFQKTFCTDC